MQIVFYILTGIVLVLILAICTPIIAQLRYSEEKLEIWIRVFGVKIKVYPLKPPKKNSKMRKSKKSPKSTPKEKESKEKEEFDVNYFIDYAKSIFNDLAKWVKWIIYKIKIYEVDLGLAVVGQDAADTAMKYAKISAIFYASLEALSGFFNINVRAINMLPDFCGEKQRYHIHFKVKIVPITMLIGIVNIAIIIIKKQKEV